MRRFSVSAFIYKHTEHESHIIKPEQHAHALNFIETAWFAQNNNWKRTRNSFLDSILLSFIASDIGDVMPVI